MSPSAQLAEKVSGYLGSRFSRRGFFARSAVVGSAVAANPLTYALRPTDAYAAVCNYQGQNCECGALCGDGYTEFCCTLTGHNQCPPGSVLGGWWKVDGTGFCSGPRYYMDCNSPSGANCGCGLGDCNNRKSGCVNFRYGQCNQQMSYIGPILCRVVTCVAPWEIDGTCTTTARYDANTAYHDRPCLHAAVGNLESAESVAGGARVRGWAFDWDTNQPVTIRFTVDGQPAGSTVANVSRPDVAYYFPGQGAAHGFDAVVPISGGTSTVCATAVNAGPGTDAPIGCLTVVGSSPFGALDVVSVGASRQVRVAGWAIDPDTNDPIQVHVYVGGRHVATTTADRSRPDVDAVFGRGANHGFDVTVTAGGGVQRIDVYGINVGSGGNSLLASRTVEIGTPFGQVDFVDPAPGGVRVRGWAIDPDTTGPIPVHIYCGGRGTPIVADRPRPDLAGPYPGLGTAHGFDVVVPGPAGRQQLDVYAINDEGPHKLITSRAVDVPSGNPFGSIDVLRSGPGSIRCEGWVLDPDSADPIQVHVYVDGQGTPLVADQVRTDVGAAYPGYGSVHGFAGVVPASPGWRQVCLYAIDVGPGENVLLGCRMVLVGGDPFGVVDTVAVSGGRVSVAGWAIDPDTADPIDVHVYVGGTGHVVTADIGRPDVAGAYPGYGSNHGYQVSVPIPPGRQDVCVYAIGRGPGGNRLLACRTVNG